MAAIFTHAMDILRALETAQLPYYLAGYSALDRYFRQQHGDNVYVVIRGSLVDLARALGELSYPGLELWDATHLNGEGAVYFRCQEEGDAEVKHSFSVLDFLYDPDADKFLDRSEAYAQLRCETLTPDGPLHHSLRIITEAAVLVSRYNYSADASHLPALQAPQELPAEFQRKLLIDILSGIRSDRGLRLLFESGFVSRYWPELAPMNDAEHSKEYHPEGNVWEHSLETFRYRKTQDLLLSLGLLLHDSGKPDAERNKKNAFSGHTELGARTGRRFLRRLGFSEGFAEDVAWLIRNHMFPGALHKLPVYRTRKLMLSPLFPLLLELYRCDLSSTYRGPDGYYRACKTYRAFLRNNNNPFRGADGKKMVQLYVE